MQDKSWGGGVRGDLADSLITDQSLSISRYFDQLIAFFSTLLLEFFQKISNLYTYKKKKKNKNPPKGIERVQGRLRELMEIAGMLRRRMKALDFGSGEEAPAQLPPFLQIT